MTIQTLYGKTESRYLELIQRFPLRPLRTEADLDAASALLDELVEQTKRTPPEQDYLEVLTDLVEAYESKTLPAVAVNEVELLRFLLAEKPLTQKTLAKETGIAESTISEILAGLRRANRGQIVKLARYFGISPAAFLPKA